jgi:hypothetical protein
MAVKSLTIPAPEDDIQQDPQLKSPTEALVAEPVRMSQFLDGLPFGQVLRSRSTGQ